ncbi:MAG: winged helix-turn-helix transcriptional regulator [Halanaerobiaceae bacterium]|jgi:DNA-binding transcriptional ArsR family regulator|nr:winged helix-turn-helix transcriptional regulator [Halanaerobiaceae bacterium]
MDDLLIKMKALADETRLKILGLLLSKNFCVRALAGRLGISESAVSQQLKILRKADLVLGEKSGYFVHYRVKKENLLKVAEEIENLIKSGGDMNAGNGE